MAEQPREKMANTAATSLTDDLVVDILSRLPIKSLCRCKCVSPHWRDLISHPDHRRRLPQTLAGFFRNNNGREVWRFDNLCEAHRPPLISTPFSFMPGYEDVSIVDACNGLLLCRTPKGSPHHVSRYIVCNPATKSWVVLPDSGSHGDDAETPAATVMMLKMTSHSLPDWVSILQFPLTSMCLILLKMITALWQGWRSIRLKLEHGVTRKASGTTRLTCLRVR